MGVGGREENLSNFFVVFKSQTGLQSRATKFFYMAHRPSDLKKKLVLITRDSSFSSSEQSSASTSTTTIATHQNLWFVSKLFFLLI
jgi:hypothetical protein